MVTFGYKLDTAQKSLRDVCESDMEAVPSSSGSESWGVRTLAEGLETGSAANNHFLFFHSTLVQFLILPTSGGNFTSRGWDTFFWSP